MTPTLRERFQGQRAVLAVNAGSSSLKCGLYPAEGPARWACTYEGLEPGGRPRLKAEGQALELPASQQPPMAQALTHLVSLLSEAQVPLHAVAHRIVHGGSVCVAPCLLDAPTLQALAALNPLAPLHQPHNLAGVAAFAQALPGVPQVGCFDTAFHASLPPLEQRLPLPAALAEQGLRRYGFHGLSYHYVSEVLAAHSPRVGGRSDGRAILAHLGNGASLCATQGGRSVATTMGFSALDGLMMGSRSGSLDPGVLLHLWRQGWSQAEVEELLYNNSGLKGVSGLSADMRTLRVSTAAAAQEAIALFTRRIVREMGGLAALLGGVELIAFTGGIGEHDAALRADVASALAFLGVRLDAAANLAATGGSVQALHAADSAVELWVVPTDEGRVAARAAFALLAA